MTYSPFRRTARRILGVLALPALFLTACDDDDPMMVGTGQTAASLSSNAFAAADPEVGADATISGTHADDFELMGAQGGELSAGASTTFEVAFTPSSVGAKNASIFISSDNADAVEAAISGTATRFQYTQVDRKGIPALNTVFNHPSGTGPFDKTAYNTASPADDVANYTDLFLTVLGAVPNSNPEATAALMLPDALPVSLAASPTAFATLTGRTLADDATDVALFVVIDAEPSLQSDNVDANDVAFRTEFPYVAEPHN